MNQSYLIQQRRQLLAFTRLLASYGCAGAGETLCDECGPCEARIWLETHNQSAPKPQPAMTDREREVLREFPSNADWQRPMDVGGRDGTDHSAVIMRLVQKGYVEMKEWGGHCKISWRYRRVAPPAVRTEKD